MVSNTDIATGVLKGEGIGALLSGSRAVVLTDSSMSHCSNRYREGFEAARDCS